MPPVYPHGTPAWVDLRCPDPERAAAFYSALFGWSAEPPIPESGGYRMFLLGGRPVAGLGPEFQPGLLPWWSTYIAVDNAKAAAKAAGKAGGQIYLKPTKLGHFGKVAIVADKAGAAVALWEAESLAGAELMGQIGTLDRVVLNTRDTESSKDFYRDVLGWRAVDRSEPGLPYVEWESQGRVVGGMTPMDGRWPAEIVPHWMVYFAVDDVDGAVERVRQLGGAVVVEPFDAAPGRVAVVHDLDGAIFSVIAPHR